MSEMEMVRFFDGDAIKILNGDPEPRMRSAALATLLQYRRHENFAALIERHRDNLNEIYRVCTVQTRPPGGGHEWTEYWLTESQCIYLAAKSDTNIANQITVLVVKQFDMYRKGLLIENGSHIASLLKEEFRGLNTAFHRVEELMQSSFAEIKFLTAETHKGVSICVEELSANRREPDQHTLRVHRYLVTTKFNRECPICRRRTIVENDMLINAHFHHHISRSNASFAATIVVCIECHKRFHEGGIEFRAIFNDQFKSYHHTASGLDLTKKSAQPCKVEQLVLLPGEKIQ
jgi:hypothetical protein